MLPKGKKQSSQALGASMWGLLILSSLNLFWVLKFCRYGYDFTDESFYLVSITSPQEYPATLSQFGYFYHPLFELVGESIAGLRQASLLFSFSLALTLSALVIEEFFPGRLPFRKRIVLGLAFAVLICLGSEIFGEWLPTPSYNTMGLQGILITLIGAIVAKRAFSFGSLLGWQLVGIGGSLVFLGKPSTAALLSAGTLFYLIGARKFNFKLAISALFSVIVVVGGFAILVDHSLGEFVKRLHDGLESNRILGGGHTVIEALRLDAFHFGKREGKVFFSLYGGFLLCWIVERIGKKPAWAWWAWNGAMFVMGLRAIFAQGPTYISHSGFQALCLLAPAAAAATIYFFEFVAARNFQLKALMIPPLAMLMLVLPYVFVFGTGNNYWMLAGSASIFWVLAALSFLRPLHSHAGFERLLTGQAYAALFLCLMLTRIAIDTPYRQPSGLTAFQRIASIGRSGALLYVNDGFADYISDAQSKLAKAGFSKGDPMFDLSGQSPGLLFAVGADSLSQAWMIGGYEGSDKLSVLLLKRVPCDRAARAWVLVDRDGPNKLAPEILRAVGIELLRDYSPVATFSTSAGVGGYADTRIQQVWRPSRTYDSALGACRIARAQ